MNPHSLLKHRFDVLMPTGETMNVTGNSAIPLLNRGGIVLPRNLGSR